jgi:hypothetical protein
MVVAFDEGGLTRREELVLAKFVRLYGRHGYPTTPTATS